MTWSFLTKHGLALVFVALNPDARIRDIAAALMITERAAHSLMRDLRAGSYVRAYKEGRRNRYVVNRDLPLRHPLVRERKLGQLLDSLLEDGERRPLPEAAATGAR